MKKRSRLAMLLALAFTLPVVTMIVAAQNMAGSGAAPARPEGPCDVYAAAGDPCVAAHSSTRALLASYNGPLYQVMRQSDGKTLDIGVVKPSGTDAGGYADAAAQDAFCANTYCWITTLYDQSGKGNHLVQAPRGGFSGPALGGFNNLPIADMAPITIMGHKAYGVFIEPGMGLRWNDAKGTAVDDQAEGQYWVVNGHHYNDGCCFDYGNAETDSRDDGNGTMETTYYGNSTGWYHGIAPGPWIMTDQENNLVGCVTTDGTKICGDLPSIAWRFVTAIAKGEPHHWTSMGGDAQQGDLKVMFDGPRINPTYDPMRKQGAILLGNGGDNSVSSQGTFYEGAMTAAGTFPTDATDQKVQANVVAAKYDAPRLTLAPASAKDAPPGLQTFSPGSSQETVVVFTNTTGAPVSALELSIAAPAGWTAVESGGADRPKTFTGGPVAPGAAVSATFKITSGPAAFNGDLVANASWTASGGSTSSTLPPVKHIDGMAEKVRNVSPVKINEFANGSGAPANPTHSFIELYNASESAVDISGWSLTQHAINDAIFSSVKIPSGTKLGAKGFYLLGLSSSGLAAPAKKGDNTIHVRSTAGMSAGDSIEIDTGSGAETRKIASVGTAAGDATTLWQPLPDGPVITIPAGSTNVPVASVAGFEVGQKIGLGYGAAFPAASQSVENYEVATVSAVGKPGTQTYLGGNVKAGATSITLRNAVNVSDGDKIRLDIDSKDHGIETVTVKKVGAIQVAPPATGAAAGLRGARGGRGGRGGLELAAPLKFNHADNMPLSVRGTGISFTPATAFARSSNEPVQPLGTGITLDQPLAGDHAINAAVRDAAVKDAGYQTAPGTPAPDLWFGGPALGRAGAIVLRDAGGMVADSLNYGGLVDPWAAEGYQAVSGARQGGNFAPSPSGGGRGGRRGAPPANGPSRSAGRFPDGADADSNRGDFRLQTATALSVESAANADNIKVASVADLEAGQTILIDAGENRESAVIAKVGTAGGTAATSATLAGATQIPVANSADFALGQSIAIDSGANQETATVAAIIGGRGGRGGRGAAGPGGRGGGPGGASITISAPLAKPHAAGALVSGTGITLAKALTRTHGGGAQIVSSLPTPGAPNQYPKASR